MLSQAGAVMGRRRADVGAAAAGLKQYPALLSLLICTAHMPACYLPPAVQRHPGRPGGCSSTCHGPHPHLQHGGPPGGGASGSVLRDGCF